MNHRHRQRRKPKPLPAIAALTSTRATSKIARIKRTPILIAGISGRMIPVIITNLASDGHYHGVTDANGQFSLVLTQDKGAGVLTSVRVVLFDGTEATQSMILPVITSPDGGRMWGHMQGISGSGQYLQTPRCWQKRPRRIPVPGENSRYWATFNSVTAATNQCGTGGAGQLYWIRPLSGPFR